MGALGITNLCRPREVSGLLPAPLSSLKRRIQPPGQLPTAILYVPYRIFSMYSMTIAGQECGLLKLKCWDPSFASLPVFGGAQRLQDGEHCAQDVLQYQLLEVWDYLRAKHEQVAVVGEVQQLHALLGHAKERIMMTFRNGPPRRIKADWARQHWRFFGGEAEKAEFESLQRNYHFQIVHGDLIIGKQCWFKIEGCKALPGLPQRAWLPDTGYGGPHPTTEAACTDRINSWIGTCCPEARACVDAEFEDGSMSQP